MTKFDVVDSVNGLKAIKITEGKFKDVSYVYGGVAVEESEDGNNATLGYSYDLLAGDPSHSIEEFEKLTGDILVNILEEQLDKNEVVYTGGQ